MTEPASVGVALVGCGWVADYYWHCLQGYRPHLAVTGVFDRDPTRLAAFSATFGAPTYRSLDELLDDPRVQVVANLTDPASHRTVSEAALLAGKHVYSEKPLATTVSDAAALAATAKARGLSLSAAPCSLLGETAQTLWAAIRRGLIGRVRLVYANLDDGMIHRTAYRSWVSESGARWPARSEFRTGCTMEHAGYYLTWLCAFFGPVQEVLSFSACVVPDKGTDPPISDMAPDFAVGCLTFASGVVARLTCSVVAPYDHRLRVIGDEGILGVEECWDYGAPVRLYRHGSRRLTRWLERSFGYLPGRSVPLVRRPPGPRRLRGPRMDFARGIAEQAEALRDARPCRLSTDFAVHVTEVTVALQHPQPAGAPYRVASTFSPIAAMPWAEP